MTALLYILPQQKMINNTSCGQLNKNILSAPGSAPGVFLNRKKGDDLMFDSNFMK
jgi:hypothetical protein